MEGSSFTCVCAPGYQKIYLNNNEATCVDENECQINHDCDGNAQCRNTAGEWVYRVCFQSDWWQVATCARAILVSRAMVNGAFLSVPASMSRATRTLSARKSTVLPSVGAIKVSEVRTTYCLKVLKVSKFCTGSGDGYTCLPITSQSCNIHNNCSPYGICSVNPSTEQYECSCLPSYTGDGYYCTERIVPESTTTAKISTSTSGKPLTQKTEKLTLTEFPANVEKVPQICENELCTCPEGYLIDEGSDYCVPYTEKPLGK